jgi:hypothetical protein
MLRDVVGRLRRRGNSVAFRTGKGTHHSPTIKGFRGISSLRSGIPRSLDARLLALFSACAERQWEM